MRLSASQLSSFRDCQRKWAWQKIANIQTPPNASASLGLEVHKQLERYLEGGSFDFTTEAGEIAASGVEFLPRPNAPGLKCEEGFAFEGPSGTEYIGYKDVEITPPDEGGEPTIIDHKTTSDLKWQKTVEQLRNDPQAVLYAIDAFRKNPSARAVHLKWIYYQTRGTRKSRITHLRILPEELLSPFEKIEQQAKVMAEIFATVKDPLELPPSIEHCSAYGGCHFQANCNLSPFERMRSHIIMSGATTSTGSNSLMARLAAAKAPPTPAAVNPPEWQPPPVPAPPPEEAKAPPAPVEAVAPPETVTAAEGAKRGRPKKTDVAAPATSAPAAYKITALFVDCAPSVPYTDASVFIQAAKLKLAAAGIADYRFPDFGHGPGMLARTVAEELDKQLGVIGYVVVDLSPEGLVVLQELKARSFMVVR